jgi:hypothetical protein
LVKTATQQVNPTTPSTMAGTMDRLERRNQLTRLRVESLERGNLVLPPHEKWPTVKSVRRYQERKSGSPSASQPSVPPAASQSNDQNGGAGSSSPKGKAKDTKTAASKHTPFPFPISSTKNSKPFPQFSRFPPEIRIQIWELALLLPRFIEAQFCTQFYQPSFVNYVDRPVLVSVCHESRAIALASAPDINSLKALTFKPHPLYRTRFQLARNHPNPDLAPHNSRGPGAESRRQQEPKPNRTLHFNPERDTIFFRSLDFPQNELSSFVHQINGMNTIQNLAIPLELWKGIPSKLQWHGILSSMPELKTVTFMVGSKEKSWRGIQQSIELRDVEQWFVDGRSREVHRGNGGTIDVKDVEPCLKRLLPYTSYTYVVTRTGRRSRRAVRRVVHIRVVAWKRERS